MIMTFLQSIIYTDGDNLGKDTNMVLVRDDNSEWGR